MTTPIIRVLDEENDPHIGALMARLRDASVPRRRAGFREDLETLGIHLGREVARMLPTKAQLVQTPLGQRSQTVPATDPVLAVVLRAGLPLWQGLLRVFPEADNVVVGAARVETERTGDQQEWPIDVSYASHAQLPGRVLVYADPMLATGSTLGAVHPRIVERCGKPERVIVVGVIAYRKTLEKVARELGADVLVASADESLNERGYIVPGLGDAGDLAFGSAR